MVGIPLKQRKEFAQQLIDILKAKELTESELDMLNQLTHNDTRKKYTFCSLANQIDTGTVLDIFFQSHNPTTLNRQGPDKGPQYRSAIFYETPQ